MSLATLAPPAETVRRVPPPFTPEPEPSSRLRKDLRASVGDGASFGLMVGMGETYLPAFVLAVGLGEVIAGLISTVPILTGAVLQLVSPWAIRRLRSHRRWVVLGATVQGLAFLPLVAAAAIGTIPAVAVMLIATIYWGAGLSTGPAWNTWAGTLVPPRVRARYFAYRTRISQAAVLIGFLTGGIALHAGVQYQQPLTAFAVLFLVAAVCRLVSARFLASQSEPVPIPATMRHVGIRELGRRFHENATGRLLLYVIAVQATVQISGPYFAPYMLKHLDLSYVHYVVLIGTSFIAKIAALPLFGRYAHRFGTRKLLWIGGLGIVPISAMWNVSDSYAWLLGLQILAGTVWAAYELAVFLMFFEAIPEGERTSVLTLFNLANAMAMVAGSLVGAAILKSVDGGVAAYVLIFTCSSLARAGTLLFLRWIPDTTADPTDVALPTIAVRPSAGSIGRPILPSVPERHEPALECEGALPLTS